MNNMFYKIATKKHKALLPLDNPFVMRSKEFMSYDDALTYAQNTLSKHYQFQILEIKVIFENKDN